MPTEFIQVGDLAINIVMLLQKMNALKLPKGEDKQSKAIRDGISSTAEELIAELICTMARLWCHFFNRLRGVACNIDEALEGMEEPLSKSSL
jgi:hypothetical protein